MRQPPRATRAVRLTPPQAGRPDRRPEGPDPARLSRSPSEADRAGERPAEGCPFARPVDDEAADPVKRRAVLPSVCSDHIAEKSGVFPVPCCNVIPPISRRTLPGPSPEPPRSTLLLKQGTTGRLRRGSGDGPVWLRRYQRAVGDAAALIPPKTAESPALIGKLLWSRDIHLN